MDKSNRISRVWVPAFLAALLCAAPAMAQTVAASAPAAAVGSVPATAASSAPASGTSTVIAVPDTPPPKVLAPAASAAAAKYQPKPEAKIEAKVEPKAVSKPDSNPPQGDKAQALLDGKDPAKSATPAAARYTVQVGAFADGQKAQEARTVLEKAGIRTYTQVVVTADGKRTRVRIGPFPSRAEADKAAARVREAGVTPAVLKL